jgi:hypothetical protein
MMDDLSAFIKMCIAGVSGGILRVKRLRDAGEKLDALKILLELASAAICSIFAGDMVAQMLPDQFDKGDNFIYFICGYGGMHVVDWVYGKIFGKNGNHTGGS